MEHSELIARAIELIQKLPYLNLATSHADVPWSSPVFALADTKLDFIWSSWVEATHSKNIHANPKAAVTIYDSTRARGTNNYRCLYLDCSVAVVADEAEAAKAFQMIYPGEAIRLDDFLAPGLKRFYKATPRKAWLNCLSERDLTPATIKMRVELDVAELARAWTRAL